MKKKFISIFLSLLTAGSCMSVISANAEEIGEDARDNIEYIKQVQNDDIMLYYDENGQEIDITTLNNDIYINERLLPSNFDLRDYERVTPVKNQGTQGLCWDFAATASMESNILSQPDLSVKAGKNASEILDLSEGGNSWYIHTNTEDENSILYNDFYSDPSKGTDGGFPYYTAYGLSAGYGAYPETLMPYEQYGSGYPEALRFYSDYRLKDYTELSNDTALIKQKLMENGAATVHYNCFESNTYTVDGVQSYYDNGNPIDGIRKESHVVAIVGWDDSFSKENFNPLMQPQNDGAWLCKNSWGEENCSTAEGYEGYFWMSYETSVYSISQFVMQSTDEYDNIYQLQAISDNSLSSDSAANIFTAKSDEKLKQISFSTNGAAQVDIKIYKLNENYISPIDGILLSSFNAETDFTGIHSFDCPDNITLSEGDIFSVVIDCKSPFQLKYGDNKNNESAGLSYYLDDGKNWIDVSDNDSVGYLSIKAYTSNSNGTDKTKLKELIKTAQSIELPAEIDSEIIEELNLQTEAAQKVADDINASQNDADNAFCLLNNSLKKITDYSFTINSVEDYNKLYNEIENKKNKNIKNIILNADLDFNGSEIRPIFTHFDFAGVFDGQNHTIKNFTICSENYASAGIFGSINKATIKNVTFSDCKVSSRQNSSVISAVCSDSVISNCRIVNSTIKSDFASSGFLCDSLSCLLENCSIENTKIYGNFGAYLFYSSYSPELSELNNCKASGNELYSFTNVDDNTNSKISATSADYDYFYRPIIKLDDSECTIDSFIGKIIFAKSEQTDVTITDGKCTLENSSDDIEVNLSYEKITEKDYLVSGDIETRLLLLTEYCGYNSDLIIPSQISGNDIVGFSPEFSLSYDIRDNIKSITVPRTIKSVPFNIFNNLMSLESVTIEEGVNYIGSSAFNGCENLSSLTLPDSLSEIGSSAFQRCSKLKNIKFGIGLEIIEDSAFADCKSITDLELPENLKTIGSYAFSGCAFMSVTIGKNIEQIGEKAFGFTGMTELDYKSIFIPEFIINGYHSTAAEQYANETGLQFIDIEKNEPVHTEKLFDYGIFVKGDVNLDGKVNIDDVTLINKWLANIENLNQVQLCNALVCDAYSNIDVDCATNIQKYIVGIIDTLYGSAVG